MHAGIPDAGARHALEYRRAEVGEVEAEVGPDEEVDQVVGFSCAGRVEEAAVHEEDGEFGEEDGGAVDHFCGVSELGLRRGCELVLWVYRVVRGEEWRSKR